MAALKKEEIPFIRLLIPFMGGLGLEVIYPFSALIKPVIFIFCGLLAAFIILNVFYSRLKLYRIKWLGGIIMSLMLLLAGIISFNINRQINQPNHFSKFKSHYLVGLVTSEPKLNSGIVRFNAQIEQAGDTNCLKVTTGNLIIAIKTDTAHPIKINYGDKILLPAKYNPVTGPANPAEFDYRAYLAHQNIYHQAFLSQHQLRVLAHNQGSILITNALKLRLYLANKLKANMQDTDATAVAATVILGYRADLRKEVQETYSKTGTMHLLSVAGMHVGLVYLMIAFALSFLPYHSNIKIIKALIAILLIWCYALITGFSPAVNRAVLMLTLVIIGSVYERHINRLNILAVSAFALLLYNPFYIADTGFQLSYVAVFGIVIIQPYIYNWLQPQNKIIREIWLVCSVSLAAQIILLPIATWYFHDFPVYFLVSNIFIIIPSAVIMYGGLIYLILPPIPAVSSSLAWLLEKTIVIMNKILYLIESTPFSSISKIWLNPIEFILGYLLIAALFYCLVQRNKQWLKISLMLTLILCVSIGTKTYRAANTSNITVFSLHKNSALLFKNGRSAILLTNLTEKDKIWQYSVQPCLDSCKINKLNCITLNGSINQNFMAAHHNLVQFKNYRLLIIDKNYPCIKLSDKLNIDYIYLTGNPHVDLPYLKQNYTFKLLIADGSNSKRFTDSFEKETGVSHIAFFNLKRNKSLIIGI